MFENVTSVESIRPLLLEEIAQIGCLLCRCLQVRVWRPDGQLRVGEALGRRSQRAAAKLTDHKKWQRQGKKRSEEDQIFLPGFCIGCCWEIATRDGCIRSNKDVIFIGNVPKENKISSVLMSQQFPVLFQMEKKTKQKPAWSKISEVTAS